MKKLEDSLVNEKDVVAALQSQASDTAPAGGSSSGTAPGPDQGLSQSRTLASPDYDGAVIPNYDRRMTFDEKPLEDFISTQTSSSCNMLQSFSLLKKNGFNLTTLRLLCSCGISGTSLKIARVKNDGSLWIVNETRENLTIGPRELFGFNIGSFAEVPSG